jgi:hypothetical protein
MEISQIIGVCSRFKFVQMYKQSCITFRPKLAQLLSPHGEMWQVTEPSPEASTP